MEKVVTSMAEKGVKVFGVCSEPQETADKTKKDWGVTMRHVGDPENEVARRVIKDGLIPNLKIVTHKEQSWHPKIGSKDYYPTGCVQPGVLFLRVADTPGRVIFSWAVQPSLSTMGGAAGRIDFVDTWNKVKPRLDRSTSTALLPPSDVRVYGYLELFCCAFCFRCCKTKEAYD